MLFHKLDFVVFLVIVLAVYWSLVRLNLFRALFVFLASCLFYMAWNPWYIFLILGSTALDYTCGRLIDDSADPKRRKLLVTISVVSNLGLLGLFKYANFFMEAIADVLGLFGMEAVAPHLNVLLPVGISFYTFQTMSYTIDIYRGKLKATRNFLHFAFYVTFFPQLVAGPIVRAVQFLPQLQRRPTLSMDQVSEGIFLILTGLAKKVVVADFLAINLIDRVFDNPGAFTSLEVVVALYAYTMQLYCDFSGYTDIARGAGKLMGLELPENFKRPYVAKSPAEFWRRWHMTLSTWLRDYLYYPLGGSQSRPYWKVYRNQWLTMFLIGMWHGASWNFVIYSNLHAFAMVFHRYFYRRSGRTEATVDPWWVKVLKIFACLNFVVFARILFRATDLQNSWAVTKQLFVGTTSLAQVSGGLWLVLIASFAAHYLPPDWFERFKRAYMQAPALAQGAALAAAAAGIAFMSTSEVVPYIYYQF